MSKFFDPIPVIAAVVKTSRGVATSGGANGEMVTVDFLGSEHECQVAGKAIASGDSVSVVFIPAGKYAIAADGGYATTERRQLSGFSSKFNANKAIRQIINENPRDYLYQKVEVTSFSEATKTAVVGGRKYPVKFGTAQARVSVGHALFCEVSNDNKHVIGRPGYGAGPSSFIITGVLPGYGRTGFAIAVDTSTGDVAGGGTNAYGASWAGQPAATFYPELPFSSPTLSPVLTGPWETYFTPATGSVKMLGRRVLSAGPRTWSIGPQEILAMASDGGSLNLPDSEIWQLNAIYY